MIYSNHHLYNRGRFENCTSLKKQSLQSHPPIRGAEAYEAMTNNKEVKMVKRKKTETTVE